MEPEELGKVRPNTLLWFARATKRFFRSVVVLGLRIGPNIHGLSAGQLWLSVLKVKVKVQRVQSLESDWLKKDFVAVIMIFSFFFF